MAIANSSQSSIMRSQVKQIGKDCIIQARIYHTEKKPVKKVAKNSKWMTVDAKTNAIAVNCTNRERVT